MKSLVAACSTTIAVAPLLATGATIDTITSAEFFDPDGSYKQIGTPSTSGAIIRTDLGSFIGMETVSTYSSGSQTAGSVSWQHENSGFLQVSTGAGLNLADAQLRSFTSISGDTLTFGRETELSGSGDLSALLTTVVNTLAGASPLQTWNSTATVNADIGAGQTYEISFNVNTASGIPVDLLSSAAFDLVGAGLEDNAGDTFSSVNLADLITLGEGDSGVVTYQFVATQSLTQIGFNFAGSAVLDTSLLGNTSENKNFISYSGFSVTPVPEPAGASLLIVAGVAGLIRRRR